MSIDVQSENCEGKQNEHDSNNYEYYGRVSNNESFVWNNKMIV